MSKSKVKLFVGILFALLTTALIVFIFTQSLKNADTSSAESGRIVRFLNELCDKIGLEPFLNQNIVRTLAHMSEFCLLGILSSISLFLIYSADKKRISFSVMIFTTVAFVDESLQLFSEGRAFQISDLIIDCIGGLLGVLVVFAGVYLICGSVKKRKG